MVVYNQLRPKIGYKCDFPTKAGTGGLETTPIGLRLKPDPHRVESSPGGCVVCAKRLFGACC